MSKFELRMCECCRRLFRPRGDEQLCAECAVKPVDPPARDMDEVSDGSKPKICKRCGKLFYSRTRSYCMDCQKAMRGTIRCARCGRKFTPDCTRATLCPECYQARQRAYQIAFNKRRKQARRAKA